ncbi:hypothetical protein RB595_003374 [Gaeumannomyces hyphopodioides]
MFFFVCGEHKFRSEVDGYQGLTCQCHNCGNWAASVVKTHPWFTLCWIPVIPFTIKGYVDVSCRVCNFAQPLTHRPDVQQMAAGGGGGGGGGAPPQYPLQHQAGPPPAQQPMRYG